jgi:serine/threonine protein kinase
MKPDRWQKIDLLFQSALACAPEEREAFLIEKCGEDERLRREVESLIASHKEGTLLDTPLSQIAAEVLLERPHRLVLGQTIGNYKILSLLGEGGMGEVYLAQDIKLGRQIALKLLPAQVTSDADRLHRFEQEAYAASALNHPNIVTIHEISQVDGEHFIVTEFIDGQTLREKMAESTIQLREALDMAIQLTSALAAAHLAGIVHRDIKPENIMLRRDGYAKLLDFGLAKLTEGKTHRENEGTRAPVKTNPGMLLGTVTYMSPEQARSLPLDGRTDIFSLGIVLYETIAHRLPFDGETSSDVIVSILEKEPIPLRQIAPEVPVELEWMIKKALAKDREQRYQTIKELHIDLQRLRQELELQAKLDGLAPVRLHDAGRNTDGSAKKSTGSLVPGALNSGPFIEGKAKSTTFGRRKVFIVGLAAIALFSLASFYAGRKQVSLPSLPTFRQLTFRRGAISGARFSPDGNTIIYGASFDGKPIELFTSRLENPQSSSLNKQADIKSISSTGEMAILLDCLEDNGECVNGTLAQLPLIGGTPRKLMEHVYQADWAPNGQDLAVVRSNEGQFQLEYPIGTVLYKASGRIQYMRVSPKGDKVAFVDQPVLGDDSGSIMTVDRRGQKRILSDGWKEEGGLAWTPSGDEIWFSAGKNGVNEIYAVASSGREPRLVFREQGNIGLKDISKDGRVLTQRGIPRSRMIGFTSDSKHERELAWFDWSTSADISADGKNLLFYEWGSAGAGNWFVYLRAMDGLSEPVELGEGKAFGLSPDGKWALALRGGVPPQLVLLPTGVGESRLLPRGDITEYHFASWFPNSNQILFTGIVDPGHGMRSYVQDISGGLPQPISPEGQVALLVAPDGKRIVVFAPEGSDGRYYLSPINGAESTPIPGMEKGEVPIQWSADGRALYVRGPGDFSTKIHRIDLANGHRVLLREIVPDQVGLIGIEVGPGGIQITPDGKSYVYTYWTALRDLFLAEGMK